MRARLAALVLLLAGLSCRRQLPATGIVVEFVSQYLIPWEMNRLDLEITSLTTGKSTVRQIDLQPPSPYSLPARMLLEPTGGEGNARIVARGVLVDGGKETVVVTQSATVGFVPDRVVYLVLPLLRICAGKSCPNQQNCFGDGVCRGDEQANLPPFHADAPFADAGGTPPAADGGGGRAGPEDASATGGTGGSRDAAPSDAAVISPTCSPPECTDFEDLTSLTQLPNGWQLTDPTSGDYEKSLDQSMGYRSQRSVHIRINKESAQVFFWRAPPSPDEYFGRIMIRTGDAPAQLPGKRWRLIQSNGVVPSLDPADHTPLYSVDLQADNLSVSYASPSGHCTLTHGQLPTRTWTCLEWHFQGTAKDANVVEVWLDGAPAPALRVLNKGGVCEETPPPLWEAPQFEIIMVGYQGEGTASVAHDLWFDDLAFGPGRIGCPP